MAHDRATPRPTHDTLELAKEEGYDPSDDELESISGGGWDCPVLCSALCQAFDKSCPRKRF